MIFDISEALASSTLAFLYKLFHVDWTTEKNDFCTINKHLFLNRQTEKCVSDDKIRKHVKEVILLSGLEIYHTCKQRCRSRVSSIFY